MNSNEIIHEIKLDPGYEDQIVFIKKYSKKAAKYGSLSNTLPPVLEETLINSGISKLYTHQAESINNIRNGENVVIVTSTASGKTLCYNIRVIFFV